MIGRFFYENSYYQTLTLETEVCDITQEMNRLELELVRMAKEDNLKKMKELELKEQTLLSKSETSKE